MWIPPNFHASFFHGFGPARSPGGINLYVTNVGCVYFTYMNVHVDSCLCDV